MTVKEQIIARLVVLLEALKTGGTVKSVSRVTSPFLLAQGPFPVIHLIIGGENNNTEDQDVQGYEMMFPVSIKVTVTHPLDPYAEAEKVIGPIQEAIEGDLQLSGLANEILYAGDDPFVNEINKPVGGNMVTYFVKYRRKRAQPSNTY